MKRRKAWPALFLAMTLLFGVLLPSNSYAETLETPGVTHDEKLQGEGTSLEDEVASEKPNLASTTATTPEESTIDTTQPAEDRAAAPTLSAQAAAQQNSASNKVYFEFLPEIFVKPGVQRKDNRCFTSPQEAIGVKRSADVYGGIPPKAVQDVWDKVAFFVYDEQGNQIDRTTGVLGNAGIPGSWSGAKYLGPYDKGHVYTIQVDYTTVPSGYYSWLTEMETGSPHRTEDVMDVQNFQVAVYDKAFTNDIAAARFHLDITSFLFAKNEEVAKNPFSVDQDKKPTGWNTAYKEGTDYVLKPVSPDGKLVLPTQEEMDKLAKEGYRPDGFYFYVVNRQGEEKKVEGTDDFVPNGRGYGYLQFWNDNRDINYRNKFRYSSIYTLVLEQSIPEVKFDRNYSDPENPNSSIATLQVYYKKSIANNCISNSCLSKAMPTAPTRKGMVFAGWNTKPDGSGQTFTKYSIVTDDVTVYAQWKKPAPPISIYPVLEVKDCQVEQGNHAFSLKNAIVKATDTLGLDRMAEVQIVDAGGFDVDKAGTYRVTYRLTVDGHSQDATATITVTEKTAPASEPSITEHPTTPTGKDTKAPRTGDMMNIAVMSTMFLLATAVYTLRKTRQRNR